MDSLIEDDKNKVKLEVTEVHLDVGYDKKIKTEFIGPDVSDFTFTSYKVKPRETDINKSETDHKSTNNYVFEGDKRFCVSSGFEDQKINISDVKLEYGGLESLDEDDLQLHSEMDIKEEMDLIPSSHLLNPQTNSSSNTKNLEHIQTPDQTSILDNLLQKHSNRPNCQCDKCQYTTDKKDGKYECPSCNAVFQYKIRLDSHIVSKHNKDEHLLKMLSNKIQQCAHCSYKCVGISNLKKHLKRHLGNKCPYKTVNLDSQSFKESKGFIEKVTLDSHILQNYTNDNDLSTAISEKVHQSSQCSYKTINSNSLEKPASGRLDTQPLKRCYKCSSCSKDFNKKVLLESHIFHNHKDDNALFETISSKVRECNRCTYTTLEISAMKRHARIHSGEKLYEKYYFCEWCSKEFDKKLFLDYHLLKDHKDVDDSLKIIPKNVYKCLKCSYKTTHPNVINRHTKDHLVAESYEKCHVCPSCSKRFIKRKFLYTHILQNHKDDTDALKVIPKKIHECSKCLYKTVCPKALKSHGKVHVKAELYKEQRNLCPFCSKEFVNKPYLNSHILQIHTGQTA